MTTVSKELLGDNKYTGLHYPEMPISTASRSHECNYQGDNTTTPATSSTATSSTRRITILS